MVKVSVRANPEPDQLILLTETHRAVAETNADRVDGLRGVYALESEARMLRVLAEQPIGGASVLLNVLRQRSEGVPEPGGGARAHGA